MLQVSILPERQRESIPFPSPGRRASKTCGFIILRFRDVLERACKWKQLILNVLPAMEIISTVSACFRSNILDRY